ncbi:hypothetical protein LAZ67_22001001 [Cordylochernes scorpioides]|uniref:Uncharacterized protein n=1 Tax=Cordylochernes scorpioides TaxID=51811 RepID=A0ABY6LRQ1_9ARAC|nr:hypothetical protein LAZ67_22001001 [Cordylochernes scorpioides]
MALLIVLLMLLGVGTAMPIRRWPGATTTPVVEDAFVQLFVRPDLALTCLQLALVAWFSLRLYLLVRRRRRRPDPSPC